MSYRCTARRCSRYWREYSCIHPAACRWKRPQTDVFQREASRSQSDHSAVIRRGWGGDALANQIRSSDGEQAARYSCRMLWNISSIHFLFYKMKVKWQLWQHYNWFISGSTPENIWLFHSQFKLVFRHSDTRAWTNLKAKDQHDVFIIPVLHLDCIISWHSDYKLN